MQARFLNPRDGILAKSEVVFDREARTGLAPDLELDGRAAGGMKTITSRHF